LVKKVQICPEIHGNTGLDCKSSISFPHLQKKPIPKKAILYMFGVISSYHSNVTIIATGCLTNVALLLTIYPEIKSKIHQIVIMGGAIGMGNMTPDAEFNILQDPEAAKIVFEAGIDFIMIPLEVTHTALVTYDVESRIREMNSPFSTLLVDLLHFFTQTYRDVFGFEYPPLHDPVAVAFVIDSSIFTTKKLRVDIDISSGRTSVDMFGMSSLPKNVTVALKVDVERFWNILIEALQKANRVSKLNHS